MIEGVGEDSGESEWWVAGVGDGCVEWGIGKRRRIDSHPVPVLSPFTFLGRTRKTLVPRTQTEGAA